MIVTFNKVGTIALRLPANSPQIISLADNKITNALAYSDQIISYNLFIKNLKAYSSVKSIASAMLPDIRLEDSDVERLYKTLDIEWKSQRKQLDMYIASEEGDWLPIGSLSLLNPEGYPYRVHSLQEYYTDNLAIELGANSKVGVAIKDVGFGLLNAADEVVIYGSWVQEFVIDDSLNSSLEPIEESEPILLEVIGNTLILESNEDRKYVVINNVGTNNCFLSFNSNAVEGQGIPINPGGHFEFYSSIMPYYKKIYAFSSATSLSIVEMS